MAFEMWLTDLICATKKSTENELVDRGKLTAKENIYNLYNQYLF